MTTPASRPAGAMPDRPWVQPVITILEFIASERPELLKALLSVAEDSPARFALLQIAEQWGIEMKDLLRLALKTAQHLDRLESRHGPRLTKDYLARQRYLFALHHFAVERYERVTGQRRRRRLRNILQRLEAGLEDARQRQRIEKIIGLPAEPEQPPADMRWLEDLIGR